jgi:hypothetical protein
MSFRLSAMAQMTPVCTKMQELYEEEVRTPPSINDPERMRMLGEFTPVPNCYLQMKAAVQCVSKSSRNSDNFIEGKLQSQRISHHNSKDDEEDEIGDILVDDSSQMYFACPIARKSCESAFYRRSDNLG